MKNSQLEMPKVREQRIGELDAEIFLLKTRIGRVELPSSPSPVTLPTATG